MMKNIALLSFLLLAMAAKPASVMAQDDVASVKALVADRLNAERVAQRIGVGNVHADSVALEGKTLRVFCNDNAAYLSYREECVKAIYADVQSLLPASMRRAKVQIWAGGRPIEDQVPGFFRSRKAQGKVWAPQADVPLLTPIDRPFSIRAGMQGRYIALWQSHGLYFDAKLDRWEWQRARLLQTVEDLYTQSYVLPFLVPMLENAGANVLLPRERDVQSREYVVDNDGTQGYREQQGLKPWQTGTQTGFAHRKQVYEDGDNPFCDGTFRQALTIKKGAESLAEWTTGIGRDGEYAVYVSYKTLPNSTRDALYTVHHAGGQSRFKVNQQMGGGTWIYLGTFPFRMDEPARVTLSNVSEKQGQIVTSDAVKIGGGMGNVARKGLLSGYPRFTEGARYWMQWAGVPDSVYNLMQGQDDYTDDYAGRPQWVNWLAGGSQALPTRDGLHIPVDLSFAFHSDAGTTKDDGIIGTLMIYRTLSHDKTTYSNGASRFLAADLADLVQSQIVSDVRALHAPEWNRRGKWNSSYAEAREPEVPAVLLELLSHQNFADMRYGLDPRFRFTVSRAIYKGMLQFLCSQHGTPYVVQPLPVSHMRVALSEGGQATLGWRPVEDALEPSAKPTSYVVYTRVDGRGWDNGRAVSDTTFSMTLEPGHIYSWKVAAVNAGGCSFDSEILSAGIPHSVSAGHGTALVVNGFDRISAPASFEATDAEGCSLAGFLDDVDHGVPYLRDISYVGKQKEFDRSIPWMSDDASGFGDSYADYETQVIAGNTFDYPYVHGQAIMAQGLPFTSCSNEAVEEGLVALSNYAMVDLILGKQCHTKMGNGKSQPVQYKAFTEPLQQRLSTYLCNDGGRLMVTGAYVGSDIWDNVTGEMLIDDANFAKEVLKYRWSASRAARRGGIKLVRSAFGAGGGVLNYSDSLNDECYVVEAPDAIEPTCAEAHTTLRYAENNLSAAVAYRGEKYATFVMGVPFEAIKGQEARKGLMQTILSCLFAQTSKK